MPDTSREVSKLFTDIVGDENDIHRSDTDAQIAGFDKTVIAGVHALGWVSAELADYGDGTTILLGFNNVSFDEPIYVEDAVNVELTPIESDNSTETIRFAVMTRGNTAVSGEAEVLVK